VPFTYEPASEDDAKQVINFHVGEGAVLADAIIARLDRPGSAGVVHDQVDASPRRPTVRSIPARS
jgi:hypothetical protein